MRGLCVLYMDTQTLDVFVWADCPGKKTERLPLFFAGDLKSVWCNVFSAHKMAKRLVFRTCMDVRVQPLRWNSCLVSSSADRTQTSRQSWKEENYTCGLIKSKDKKAHMVPYIITYEPNWDHCTLSNMFFFWITLSNMYCPFSSWTCTWILYFKILISNKCI